MLRFNEYAYIDEFFLAFLLCTSGLILEDDVVIPPPLDVESLRIEQRVAECNVDFPFALFFRSLLCFLLDR